MRTAFCRGTMRKTIPLLTGIVLLTSGRAAFAQHQHKHTAAKPDSAFQALQERGKRVMGVDQYTSSHVFESSPGGGRVELQRDVDDRSAYGEVRLTSVDARAVHAIHAFLEFQRSEHRTGAPKL